MCLFFAQSSHGECTPQINLTVMGNKLLEETKKRQKKKASLLYVGFTRNYFLVSGV